MDYTAGIGTTALGILGTTLGGIGAVNGGLLNGILGRNMNGMYPGMYPGMYQGMYPNAQYGLCSDDHFVTRYEQGLQAKIAEQATDIKLRDSTIYTDKKSLELYENLAGRINALKDQLGQQAVLNQKTADSFALANADLMAVKSELHNEIKMEAEKRHCADESIVHYANATFYPKLISGITPNGEVYPQRTYDPVDCCCGND